MVHLDKSGIDIFVSSANEKEEYNFFTIILVGREDKNHVRFQCSMQYNMIFLFQKLMKFQDELSLSLKYNEPKLFHGNAFLI